MFNRFTPESRRAVLAAVEFAQELGHPAVRPEHLLVGAFRAGGVAARVLASFGLDDGALVRAAAGGPARRAGLSDAEVAALRTVGIDADDIVRRMHEAIGPAPATRLPRWGSPFDRSAKDVLEQSLRESLRLKHRHLGPEHILLAVLATEPAMPVLAESGVSHAEANRRVLAELRRAS